MSRCRVAILFDNFGPYHLARLGGAAKVCDLLAVEFGDSSAEYDWEASASSGYQRVTLHPKGVSGEPTKESFEERISKLCSIVFNYYKKIDTLIL